MLIYDLIYLYIIAYESMQVQEEVCKSEFRTMFLSSFP